MASETVAAPGATTLSSDNLNNKEMDTLQSQDARKLMDVVDSLRKTGLGGIVQLPQIVTCGDQSSGKSSVLEAITGIPFPRKENLCTRYATQIVLRRAKTDAVSVTIYPDKLRPQCEQDSLEKYTETLSDFSQLGDLMEEVTALLGLGSENQEGPRAFSRDVLNIEISGPGRPHLTLVDLPGLIHSENKQQTKEDVATVKALVEDYIKEKRTIVLAVVSAKNDYANQIILGKAREFEAIDRTLGVITKPDYLAPGSENEKSWIELAQNRDVFFGLGWHSLKNRSEKEMSCSLAERDQNESFFFSQGSYRLLDIDMLGVAPLRKRLSKLLFKHLTSELPGLQKELNDKCKEAGVALKLLGNARTTTRQQRRYLMEVGQNFEKKAQASIDGHYEEDFFGTVDASRPVDDPVNARRLRAVVQNANLQFARQMRLYGAKYKITGKPKEIKELDSEEAGDIELDSHYAKAEDGQTTQTHKEAVRWVQNILERSRGRELPGNFNPLLISQLFKDQSEPWQLLAEAHIDRVASHCAVFVRSLLQSLTLKDVFDKIMLHKVDEALDRRHKAAHRELSKIMLDKNSHPITYNHYYTDTIQKIRRKKQTGHMKMLVEENTQHRTFSDGKAGFHVDEKGLIASMASGALETDMDRFSADDALTSQLAYYKDELKYFVNCVTKQIIERCLIRDLSTDIISSVDFGEMTDEQVSSLAADPDTIIQERERLQTRFNILEEGQAAFKAALGGF